MGVSSRRGAHLGGLEARPEEAESELDLVPSAPNPWETTI